MKTPACLLPVTLAFGIAAGVAITPLFYPDPSEHTADLVEEVMPTTVFISVEQNGSSGSSSPQKSPVYSNGSGFVIDGKNGYIVTNSHVIGDGKKATIYLATKEKREAEIIGNDSATDIAVLKINGSQQKLPAVQFGNSNNVRIGEEIIAIGNPFHLTGTVTKGIISGLNRNVSQLPLVNFIQTDAAMNQGSSGGGLFNKDGELIGINAMIHSPKNTDWVGISYSIPSNTALNIINQLIQYGEVQRGWLGASVTDVTDDLARRVHMKETGGVIVSFTETGSPAQKAGIKDTDVILAFNGIKINKTRDLLLALSGVPIGKTVDITIWRDGQSISLPVTIELQKKDKTMPPLAPLLQHPPAPQITPQS